MVLDKLDSLDFKILRELTTDGRISITDLSIKAQSSRPTVTNRLKRMRELGLLNVVGGLNFIRLGYKMAVVGLEVKTEESRKEAIEILSKCPRVQTIFRSPKKANIEIVVWGENDQTINSTVESFRDLPNVEIVNINYLGAPIKGDLILRLDLKGLDETPCGLVCADCHRFQNDWCHGCPDSKDYKNPLMK
jgi:Lrp/AsnC family leucine-responsive transcriptional regulator